MNSKFGPPLPSKLLIVIAIAALAVLLIGCKDRRTGDSTEDAPSADATATSTSGAEAPATATTESSAAGNPTSAPNPPSVPALADPAAAGAYQVGAIET